MLTYQDFEKANDKEKFVKNLIEEHKESAEVETAKVADLYFARRNKTINEYVQRIYSEAGIPLEDYVASNNKIASNFFWRLNTQRCMYSLGNGVTFEKKDTKKKLGEQSFDTELKKAAKLALIHGCSFMFLNVDKVHVFPMTKFAPLWDEDTGALRAGVRFWRLDREKPTIAVLYEEDGYTRLRAEAGKERTFKVIEEKRAYKRKIAKAPADSEPTVLGEENYGGKLPIVTLWGNEIHQSTLIGMQQAIDSFDLVRSGFANDLQDCAQIYWILENYGGMTKEDLAKFRDQIKLMHIAQADTGEGGGVKPYTQEIPHEARIKYLEHIRAGIYEDFGGLDVHTIAAGATNDHIDAAYQPLDENADDFEFQIIEAVQGLLRLIGVEDTPRFKRNRISNWSEQVDILVKEAGIVDLDDETLLEKFPNFTPEEVKKTLERIIDAGAQRMTRKEQEPTKQEPEQQEPEGEQQDGEA